MRASATFAGALASTNAIKTSIATVASPVTYLVADFNGTLGATPGVNGIGRTVSVTSSAHSGSYIITSPIVVTGTDTGGNTITENLTLTAVNGGETIVGKKLFKTITSIAIPAMTDTLGAFTFGVRDAGGSFQQIRCGTGGDLKVAYAEGAVDTIKGAAIGEKFNGDFALVYGDSGTTAQGITLGIAGV